MQFDVEATDLKLSLLWELGPVSSWNTRGLFAADPALRRSKLRIANSLGDQCKLAVFQETHGEASDWTLGFLPNHFKFVSAHPKTKGKAGVIIAIEKNYLADQPHDWDHIHQGRIARLRIPSATIDEAIVSVYVVHLEGENNSYAEQQDLIVELKRVLWDDESDLIMLLGDFNFAVSDIDRDDWTFLRLHHLLHLRDRWCIRGLQDPSRMRSPSSRPSTRWATPSSPMVLALTDAM